MLSCSYICADYKLWVMSSRGGPKFAKSQTSAEQFGRRVQLSSAASCYSALFLLHTERRALQLFTLIFLAHDVFCIDLLAFNFASMKIRKRFYYWNGIFVIKTEQENQYTVHHSGYVRLVILHFSKDDVIIWFIISFGHFVQRLTWVSCE